MGFDIKECDTCIISHTKPTEGMQKLERSLFSSGNHPSVFSSSTFPVYYILPLQHKHISPSHSLTRSTVNALTAHTNTHRPQLSHNGHQKLTGALPQSRVARCISLCPGWQWWTIGAHSPWSTGCNDLSWVRVSNPQQASRGLEAGAWF